MQLTSVAECPGGHPRSALRDVREGGVAPEVPTRPAAPRSQATVRSTPATGPRNPRPNLTRGEQTTAHVMGKFIVIGPATVVVVFALWSSYTISVGMGMSRGTAAESSVLELALTGVTVAFMVWNRRRKM